MPPRTWLPPSRFTPSMPPGTSAFWLSSSPTTPRPNSRSWPRPEPGRSSSIRKILCSSGESALQELQIASSAPPLLPLPRYPTPSQAGPSHARFSRGWAEVIPTGPQQRAVFAMLGGDWRGFDRGDHAHVAPPPPAVPLRRSLPFLSILNIQPTPTPLLQLGFHKS